jgi:hypothetical protein
MLKMTPNFVLGSKTSSTYLRRYACGVFLPAALPEERCVSARQGWAGENKGHFEHPANKIETT